MVSVSVMIETLKVNDRAHFSDGVDEFASM